MRKRADFSERDDDSLSFICVERPIVLLMGITYLSSHLELSCRGSHTSCSLLAEPSTDNSLSGKMRCKHSLGEIRPYYNILLSF